MSSPSNYSFFKAGNLIFEDDDLQKPVRISKVANILPNSLRGKGFDLKTPLFAKRLTSLDYLRGIISGADDPKNQVQAVIKVISSSKNISGVKDAVNYIARFVGFGSEEEISKRNAPKVGAEDDLGLKTKLKLAKSTCLYDQDGNHIKTKDEATKKIQEWNRDFKKGENIMSHMLFSVGGEEEKNKKPAMLATKKFLEDHFKARGFDYFFAAHYDTKNHHFHVIVKKKNKLGLTLYFDKHDLFVLRDQYAKALTAYGVKRATVARMDQKQILGSIEKKLANIREQNTHYQSKLAAAPAEKFNAYVYKARICTKLEALIKEIDYYKSGNKEMGFLNKVNLTNSKIDLKNLKKQIVKSTNGEQITKAITMSIKAFAKDNVILAKKLHKELNLDDTTKFAYLKPKETIGYLKQILDRQFDEIVKAQLQLKQDLSGTKFTQEERGVVQKGLIYFDEMKEQILKLKSEVNNRRGMPIKATTDAAMKMKKQANEASEAKDSPAESLKTESNSKKGTEEMKKPKSSYIEELILSRKNVKVFGSNAPYSETSKFQKEAPGGKANYLIPILSESDIKQAFLEAVQGKTTFNPKFVAVAMDKAFDEIGQRIRFGERKDSEICWYGEAGYVKSYKTGEIFKYGVGQIKAEDNTNIQFKEISTEEMAQRIKRSEEAKIQSAQEKLQRKEAAADKAEKMFETFSGNSESKSRNHQYLLNKKISNIGQHISGIKFTEDNKIVIPLRGIDDNIYSLQFIGQDGSKIFLKDGEKKGKFFMIGQEANGRDPKEIFVTEGFATAATIYQAVDKPVVVCFDAGNLDPVISGLKTKYPTSEIIIAADNDIWGELNVGKEKAELAAVKYGTKVVLPEFNLGQKEDKPTDFNDLSQLMGNIEVEKQISEQLKSFGRDQRLKFS